MRSARFRGAIVALRVIALAAAAVALRASAQPPSSAQPEGLHDNTPAVHALINAKLVLSPGRTIEKGTVIVRDGVIVAVGASADVAPPPAARVWDLAGKTLYPGFIDAYSEPAGEAPAGRTAAAGARTGTRRAGAELLRPATPEPSTGVRGGATYWNTRVTPQLRMDEQYRAEADTNKKLRSQGIVARLLSPPQQIVKGTSAAVTTADSNGTHSILRPIVAMHLRLTPAGAAGAERSYPVSPMGAYALVRQAMYDAQWYAKARAAWEADGSLPRPEKNDALEALQPVISGSVPVVIDAPDEQYALRADRIAREFHLNAIIRGSGEEFRRLEQVAATGRPVIVPVNFVRPPNVASPEAAVTYSLEDLMDWDLQPENPARLAKAGVKIALTSHGLRDRGTFLAAVKKAVARGLGAEAALRALTVTPAELLGLSQTHGSIEVGKSASLLVADGDLFDKGKVLETWVDGLRYEVVPQPAEEVRGTWKVTLGEGGKSIDLQIGGELARLRGTLGRPNATPRGTVSRPGAKAGGPRSANDLSNLSLTASRISFTFKGDAVGMNGVVLVSATVSGDGWLGTGIRPDGSTFTVTATRVGKAAKEQGKDEPEEAEPGGEPATRPAEAIASAPQQRAETPPGEREQPTTATSIPQKAGPPATQPAPSALARQAEKASTKPSLFDVNYPLGAYGRAHEPEQPPAVVFRNATVWTCGPQGKLQRATVVVEHGKIAAVLAADAEIRDVPADAVVVDCGGMHLTPGVIDCHSHIATDGGINEGSRSVTCEVRVGDFIDPSNINIYRQLAGGVTSSNILHGSANTIGGQNQVIKMRWGAYDDGLKFKEAPQGVKFALGENVKQSNSTTPRERYPRTRMGVEQIVRDSFNAARDYKRAWDEYKQSGNGLPPRLDLRMEALCEILSGKRIIHCHSYRQDEILALMRTCEQFGVKIATFQHVLEGYKIADQIARHGAGGSAFSDWWAYKFEAYDAIPYCGALMYQAGIVVSYNSDDAELARRLNLEAAKAVKYGGVPEEEAMKFVTLNPAKQLRIDRYVGSIEPGKDADLVVWSGSPLSPLSRCEQTWIDGRRYFDRREDEEMRTTARQMRAALVQKILSGGEAMGEAADADPRPRDVWSHGEDCVGGDCNMLGMFR